MGRRIQLEEVTDNNKYYLVIRKNLDYDIISFWTPMYDIMEAKYKMICFEVDNIYFYSKSTKTDCVKYFLEQNNEDLLKIYKFETYEELHTYYLQEYEKNKIRRNKGRT